MLVLWCAARWVAVLLIYITLIATLVVTSIAVVPRLVQRGLL